MRRLIQKTVFTKINPAAPDFLIFTTTGMTVLVRSF